jgi:autotransporter-associated beta strand protein
MKKQWLSIWVMVVGIYGASLADSDSWNVDADGLFLTNANWAAGVAPGQTALKDDSTDVATFTNAITAARTVTLDGANRNLAGFTFGSSGSYGFTLATSGVHAYYLTAGSVIQTLSGTGGHVDTIAASLNLLGDATFRNDATAATALKISSGVFGRASSNETANLTLAGGSISGQNALQSIVSDGSVGGNLAVVKNGPGTWTLNANNTFTGGLTVNSGTMRYYGTGTSLGQGTITMNGGALQHANTSVTIITNAMIANGDFSLTGSSGTQWGGPLDLSGGTRTITVSADTEFDKVLSNGGLVKAGISTLTLSAESDFAGGTTISEGTLVATAAGALGAGDVTNNAALTLSSVSCLDAYATLVLSSDCTLTLDYSGTNSLAALSLDGGATYLDTGSYDAAALTSLGSGTYSGSGVLRVSGSDSLAIGISSISSSETVMSWEGSVSKNYTLQSRTDLLSGTWSNVLENISGLSGSMYVTSNITGDQAFYRVLSD